MTERKPRKDATRNRDVVFAAADALFANDSGAEEVTMADIAAAAGVGKGTLFRAFGDRTGLIRALYAARLEPLNSAVETGDPPLGPGTPPRERISALLDAMLCFKLDNRHLALALEQGSANSPYGTANYEDWHLLIRELLGDRPAADFTAHALLAAVRADLVEYLTDVRGLSRAELREQLSAFADSVL
ncbi:TetR/AcrR family transcriptional regulator [Pseudonocardiaceae bacterium YIM PH 21723]|nr:TetR/AcrR family transcriptional regulator [Pseudonocardiaceae bacterium YIM PH 21723]